MKYPAFHDHCKTVYHVSCGESWETIRRSGLLSAAEVMSRCGLTSEQQREDVYRERLRSNKVLLVHGIGRVVLRDQKPLCWEGLRKAVEPEMTPLDWINELNARIFLWVRPEGSGNSKGADSLTQAKSYAGAAHTIIEMNSVKLVEDYESLISVTTFNVGYAMRKPKRRNATSFQRLANFARPFSAIRELTVLGSIPNIEKYVTRVTVQDTRGGRREIFAS